MQEIKLSFITPPIVCIESNVTELWKLKVVKLKKGDKEGPPMNTKMVRCSIKQNINTINYFSLLQFLS